MTLSSEQRSDLKQMIDANETEDFTDVIRRKNHSPKIRADVATLLNLKSTCDPSSDYFNSVCDTKCEFLHTNYPEIYTKLKSGKLDLNIFGTFVDTLRRIENGEMDQHEASYQVGLLLKKLYVDTVINTNDDGTTPTPAKTVSWSEYKQSHIM